MHLRTEALELSLSCKIIKNKADIQRWQRTRIVLTEDDLWEVAIICNENKASGLTCKHTVANYTPDDINVYTISYIILYQTAPNINTKAATNLTHRLLQNCTPSYTNIEPSHGTQLQQAIPILHQNYTKQATPHFS